MKFNDNEFVLNIETQVDKKEDPKKIHKKIISKTTLTYQKVVMDKLSGNLGEC
jgi:hypothetical protein